MFSSMPTSFSPRKTAAKPNLENQPPYAAVSNNETTTYGGIFNHWNSFASEGHEKSPVFGPGIYASICGSRLLAPTWANKPKQHGVFFTCSGIKNAPSHGNLRHYTMRGGLKSRDKPWFYEKCCTTCLQRRLFREVRIKEAVRVEIIKPLDPTTSNKYMKYIPIWA